MCGIVGMAGTLTFKHITAFRDMLIVNQLRGRDATGVIRVANNGADRWMKRVGPPEFLVETKEYDKEIETAGCKVLIGHGRAKTVGESIHRNAHPFDHGNIVGVHNGTLRNYYSMERYRDFDVDSDLLYWHINEYGIEETISQLDNSGAWALVYWNREDGTLNFIRNVERPLYFAHSADSKVMFWASEPWYFSTLTRKGIDLRKDENGSSFYSLPIETLVSYKIDATKTEPNEIFTVRVTKDVKGAAKFGTRNFSPPASNTYYNNTHYHRGGSVPRPFDAKADLNDRLPPSLMAPAKPVPNQAASTVILGSDGKPLKSSQTNTDSSTAQNDGKNGQRPKLSLVSNNTSNSQQASNANISKRCGDFGGNSEKRKVSFRTVAGIEYITDNKTSREFSIADFDERTSGYCSYCVEPIGDITDVHEIFISPKTLVFDEMVTFVCSDCVDPSKAVLAI